MESRRFFFFRGSGDVTTCCNILLAARIEAAKCLDKGVPSKFTYLEDHPRTCK